MSRVDIKYCYFVNLKTKHHLYDNPKPDEANTHATEVYKSSQLNL